MKVSTSILSIKDNLKENIEKLDNSSTDYIHLDIMDGIFVPNSTWEYSVVRNLVEHVKKPLDVHLMVSDLDNYIRNFSQLKPDYITFHLEATDDTLKYINMIKEQGIKVGLSIKPSTSIESLKPYLNEIDLVLVMSVEPGAGGQSYIPSSTDKIIELTKLREEYAYNYIIEVDGGINEETIYFVKQAGADMVVSGSYIINCDDYEERILSLK